MKHIYFATSNEYKFGEARQLLGDLCPDISLSGLEVDIPEIQSERPGEILKQKVDYISQKTQRPFIVDDAYFDTERYPGFPGPYAKFANSTLGYEGWRRLFQNGDRIRAVANVALHYLGTTCVFEGQIEGFLQFGSSNEPDKPNIISDIMFVREGISLGHAIADPEFASHRGEALLKLATWLNSTNREALSQKIAVSERWSERSKEWVDVINNSNSYVNFEQNYSRVNEMIKKYAGLVNGKALEIGCGTGEAGRILKEANPDISVLSTDISDGMLQEAARQTREADLDIEYKKLDIVTDDLGVNRFDILLSRGVVISHLPRTDVLDWLESASRLANPRAYFIFDFIQSVKVGEIEKPVDSKNEFSLEQMNLMMRELGWRFQENHGTNEMRVQVVCYQKEEE